MEAAPLVRVMALHALRYCERLFYLEEVEELRVADRNVWAGRRLHLAIDPGDAVASYVLDSSKLGITGKFDAIRKKDGRLVPVEHKRGRSRPTTDGPGAWPSDTLQCIAYALLLSEHTSEEIQEAQVFYHNDRQLVKITINKDARMLLHNAVNRAQTLRRECQRPPITENENLCRSCSLSPVCLPEEQRHFETRHVARRLFPEDSDRRSLHVVSPSARIGRMGDALKVTQEDGTHERFGSRDLEGIVLHGYPQITTQALRLCSTAGIPVHWLTTSGSYVGTFAGQHGGVQRRIRQFRALSKRQSRLNLARLTLSAKVEQQLRLLLRLTRSDQGRRQQITNNLEQMRSSLKGLAHAASVSELIGFEGLAAKNYFQAMPSCIGPDAGPGLVPKGRSRRPPRDAFNCLLSFAYALLYRDLLSVLIRVGLEPSLGFLHQPRSASYPLACDLMEIFRVPIVDTALLAATNRKTFELKRDFIVTPKQVWLSDEGRSRLIGVYESRKDEVYQHPILKYSLSFRRHMELEARLLEKEWSGEAGLYARLRLR